MYRSRNAAPEYDNDGDEGYSYEDEGAYMEDEDGTVYTDQNAGLTYSMRSDEHLQRDLFRKVQTVYLHMEITGTPEQLANGDVETTWKVAPHIAQHLKQIMATRNRDKAVGADLAGNLRNCIPLHAEVVSDANSFPYKMGFKFPGMVPKVMTSTGRYTWTTDADAPSKMVNRAVFDPTNIINQYMYDNWSKCSLESLEEDITHLKGKNEGFSTINVVSLPFQMLVMNLDDETNPNNPDAKWTQYHLTEEEIDEIYDAPVNGRKRQVMVPTPIAQDIYDRLKGPLEDISKSFVKLDDMVVEFERADGYKKFNDFRGLHKELVGNGVSPKQHIRTKRLNQRCTYSAMFKLDFLLF